VKRRDRIRRALWAVGRLARENEAMALEADRSGEIIGSLRAENEQLAQSLEVSQASLADGGLSEAAIPQILETVRELRSSARALQNEEVFGRLHQAVQRLKRLKARQATT